MSLLRNILEAVLGHFWDWGILYALIGGLFWFMFDAHTVLHDDFSQKCETTGGTAVYNGKYYECWKEGKTHG